jgi:hypothetical protein
MRPIPDTACLACGEPIEETLFRLGSPRCLECRQSARPLDPALAGVALNGHARNGGGALLGLRLRPTEEPSTAA